jgi:SpoVK/Ycf46/Vps4 family AAA+-type ATPase
VFEELANVAEGIKMERLLDFLDGERSVDKSLVIATTNYPERLPGNLVDRPSRFDKLYKMGNPSEAERRKLLGHYLMREALDVEVAATKGLSTAAIKESCMLHHLQGVAVAQATKLLKDHKELVKKEFAESRSVGIGLGAYGD